MSAKFSFEGSNVPLVTDEDAVAEKVFQVEEIDPLSTQRSLHVRCYRMPTKSSTANDFLNCDQKLILLHSIRQWLWESLDGVARL